MISRRILVTALLSALVALPVSAAENSWDGTWSGKWGGKSSGTVRIKNNKVVGYYLQGNAQRTGSTTISGNKLSFGSGYNITMIMNGKNSAQANYKGNGTASATLVRK